MHLAVVVTYSQIVFTHIVIIAHKFVRASNSTPEDAYVQYVFK